MKLISRSTLGVVIGGLNIFGFSIIIIYMIVVLTDLNEISNKEEFKNDAVIESSTTFLYILLVICVIAIIISSFLILGIVMKRPSFMMPWIISAIAGMSIHIVRAVYLFASEASLAVALGNFFLDSLIFGVQCFIFCSVYSLYKDLRVGGHSEQEQSAFSSTQKNPPNYGQIEKGEESYN